jgi:hypothetical protein
MSISTAWTNRTPASTARKNKMTVISDTGTNLTALDKSKHRVVFCTADGGEFLKDHTYTSNADADEWIDITDTPFHTHFDDGDGGSIFYLWDAHSQNFQVDFIKPTDWLKAQWVQTVTGTGTIEDAEDASGVNYIRLRPNGTSGSSATIAYPMNLNPYFGEVIKLQINVLIETASSIAAHVGVNADDITAADSNTRKIQAEVCTATNNNWYLRTANGSGNSASDSGQAITTSKTGLVIHLRPNEGTPDCLFGISGTRYIQKTTHIPVDQSATAGNTIKLSVKNSTAADRPLRGYGARLAFQTADAWGYSISSGV